MHDDTAFSNSIPKFLRRPEERPAPGRAFAFQSRPTVVPPPAASTIHGGLPPVQPDLSAAPPPAPTPIRATPAPVMQPPRRAAAVPWIARKVSDIRAPAVVDLTERRDASAQAEAAAHRMHLAARTAFDAEIETGDDDDTAFQVTLPRSVIRQIRMVAAAEGTTHRAIVLRALRDAGLEIPEGADVDRRAAAAKRRQQA